MSNDARRNEMTEVLDLVQEQLADIAEVQKKQAKLTASATSADAMVEVTVNAHGHLIKTVIDESYLDDYEFEELSDHVTEAAQAAARTVARRVADMMVPISERRKAFPSLSDIVDGAPDLRELMPRALDPFAAARPGQDPEHVDGRDVSEFPTVRR